MTIGTPQELSFLLSSPEKLESTLFTTTQTTEMPGFKPIVVKKTQVSKLETTPTKIAPVLRTLARLEQSTEVPSEEPADESSKEEIITDSEGRTIRRITRTATTKQRIIRRKIIDEYGIERVVEVTEPESPVRLEESFKVEDDDEEPDSTVILHAPTETDTTSKEEVICDEEGKIIKRIIKKVTNVTKKTRIIRRIVIDADGNETVTEEEVPIEEVETPGESEGKTYVIQASPRSSPKVTQKQFKFEPQKVKTVHLSPMDINGEMAQPDAKPEEKTRRTVIRKREASSPKDSDRKEPAAKIPASKIPQRGKDVKKKEAMPSKLESKPPEEPQLVERHITITVKKLTSGEEKVLDESEVIIPIELTPIGNPFHSEETEQDSRGRIAKTVVGHNLSCVSQRSVESTIEKQPSGNEKELDKKIQLTEKPRIDDRQMRVSVTTTGKTFGKESTKEHTIMPLKVSETRNIKETLDRQRGKSKIVKRNVDYSFFFPASQKITEVDNKAEKEQVITVLEPVEEYSRKEVTRTTTNGSGKKKVVKEHVTVPYKPKVIPDTPSKQIQQFKDTSGSLKVVTKPVPVVTQRTVITKIIILPNGKEQVEEIIEERTDISRKVTRVVIKIQVVPAFVGSERRPKAYFPAEGFEEHTDEQGNVVTTLVKKTAVLSAETKEVKRVLIGPEEGTTVVTPSDYQPIRTFVRASPVDRYYVTRVMRSPSQDETVIDHEESVVPTDWKDPSDSQEQDEQGKIIQRTFQKSLSAKSKCSIYITVKQRPDGTEEEIERSVEELGVEEEEPEDKLTSLEHSLTLSTDEKVVSTEKDDEGLITRMVKRITNITTHRPLYKTTVTSPQQTQPIEEDIISEPIETSGEEEAPPPVVLKEEKDTSGAVVRRIVRHPVPVVTQRKVFRKILVTPEGKEEPLEERIETMPTEEEVVPVEMEPDETMPMEDEPVIRRTVTLRKKIIKKIIILPDGTKKEVQEEVLVEPEPEIQQQITRTVVRREPEEVTRRQVYRTISSEKTIEPEEVVTPMDVGETETLPEEPLQRQIFRIPLPTTETPSEPIPEEAVTLKDGQIVRRTVRVKKKTIRKVIILPDGSRKEVDEEVPEEEVVVPTEVEESEALPDEPTRRQIFRTPVPKEDIPKEPTPEETVTLEDGRIIRRTVTVRKRTIRKIIILPDGTRQEVEEEVPEEAPEQAPEKKEPRKVERQFITRLMREPDGTKRLIDESETITPLEVEPTEQEPEQVCIKFSFYCLTITTDLNLTLIVKKRFCER